MLSSTSLIPIIGLALFFYVQFNRKVSVSIFFAISTIIVSIFIFGIFDFLKIGTYLMFYTGVGTLVYFFFKHKDKTYQFVKSVPLVMFVFTSIVYLYMMKDAQIFFWDEYSHWGAFIKEMFYFHHFYDATSVAAHLRYPPGISIWDYFILLPHGFYSEGSIYFAYFLILFSSVLMMYENLKWNHFIWIITIFISQMAIFATYGHWFSSIYVDHIIGAMFTGMVLSYLVDKYNYKQLLLFIFPAVSITLVKEIGLFFVLSFAGLVLILSFYNSKLNNSLVNSLKDIRKIVVVSFIIFVSAFLVLKIWNMKQDSLNIPKEHQSISGISKAIMSGKASLELEKNKEVSIHFWEVVENQQLHKEEISLHFNEFSYELMDKYNKELKLSTTGSFIFFFVMIVMLQFTLKERIEKNLLFIVSGYLLFVAVSYLFILYFSFLVAFGDAALRIPSYVRYMNMAVLPLFMILIYFFLPVFSVNRKKLRYVNSSVLIFGLFLISFLLITKPYFKPLYSSLSSPFRNQLDIVTPKILEHIPEESTLLVVFPVKNNGRLNIMLRYMLIPTQTTILKDDFFIQKSEEEVLNEYRKYDYIWFTAFDQNTFNKSKTILRSKSAKKLYALYKISRENNSSYAEPIL